MTINSNSNNSNTTNRLLTIVAIMSATLMQVLDTTIVNVALPHMQGSLNASWDQISWTLTSYLISSAIMMPLTGYFSDRLGRKKYLLWCISGFTLASALCGMSTSITQIVAFRLLQGIFGAALVPLSQAILVDMYPRQELGKAMAIWGTGVMVGPVLGPTLGGYLTDIVNWRWTFYVNIPVGIMAFLLAWRVIPDTNKKYRSFDWLGFLLIAITIGAVQYFFDRGNHDDWFNAFSIRIAAFLAITGFISFLIYNYYRRGQTVFDISVFKDRNFTISSLLLLALGVGIFGSMVLFPMFLENLLNYPVSTAGLMMTPRAISVMISMIVMGKISNRLSPRLLIISGIIWCAIGTYSCTQYSLAISKWWLIWPSIIQGLGLGMIMVPLSTIAFSTIPDKLRAEAAGLNSLLRTLGASIGIAVTLTVYTRNTQTAWNNLIGFINPYNQNLYQYLHLAQERLQLPQSDPSHPIIAKILGYEITRQASMVSLINQFVFITDSFLLMLPFVFLLRHIKNTNSMQPNPCPPSSAKHRP